MKICISLTDYSATAEYTCFAGLDSDVVATQARYGTSLLYDIDHEQTPLTTTAAGDRVTTLTVKGPWAAKALLENLMYLQKYIGSLLHVLAKEADERNGTCLAPAKATRYPIEWVIKGQAVEDNPSAVAKAFEQPGMVHLLGPFKQKSSVMRVTDPGYSRTSNGAKTAQMLQVLPGTWKAAVIHGETSWHRRVLELQVRHESTHLLVFADLTVPWKELPGLVDVDTGSCGFFDEREYPKEEAAFEYYNGLAGADAEAEKASTVPAAHRFYSHCYTVAHNRNKPGAGVIPGGFGVVSLSGMGDGVYSVFVLENNEGVVVAAKLVYCKAKGANDSAEDEDDD